MPATLRISANPNAALAKLRSGVERIPKRAVAGINRAAAAGFTVAVREIQRDVGASAQKSIRRNLSVSRATDGKPEARIIGKSAKKERIPLIEMRPSPKTVAKRRPTVPGVTYGLSRKTVKGSFIARMKSAHVGVFKRVSEKRLPIAELFGPSVALVFSRRRILDKVKARIREVLPGEIARALKFART